MLPLINIMADTEAEVTFKKETMNKLLTSFFKEEKSRLSSDAVVLMAEMLKIFVQEAAVRSQKQAEAEDCEQVDIEHFEKSFHSCFWTSSNNDQKMEPQSCIYSASSMLRGTVHQSLLEQLEAIRVIRGAASPLDDDKCQEKRSTPSGHFEVPFCCPPMFS
uniref:Centromere protein X n=1 Tax=Neogobius melanostomus TaxID=47308 RepID=A0A8C6T5B8_9GOBI